MTKLVDYAAVAVHYRGSESLAESLAGLFDQTHAPAMVVVVDNSASQVELLLPPSLASRVTILPSPTNGGYAAAMNRARPLVKEAGLEQVLFMTQDVQWESTTVEALGKQMGPDTAVVGPVLRLRSSPDEVFSSGGSFGYGGRVKHMPHESLVDAPSILVDWVDGAVMLVSADALARVDWFDERYFLYYEEVDLCYRFRSELGMRTRLAPAAMAYQEPGNYTPYLRLRNQILFWRKHFRGVPGFIAAGIQFGKSSVRSILNKRPSGVFWALRGVLDGVRGRGGQPPLGIFARGN